MATAHPPKKKPRLLVRLGTFIVSHSVSVSVLCCLAGLLTLLLLPVLAKNTYVSENALMPDPVGESHVFGERCSRGGGIG
ncbi:hypothetical protein QJS10_CPA09g00717 [Acorus calamus]|uniref:Uncharacterized protein n=1 Tax=Acorus calamus TaxID=4465 RepID=A0AAV9EB85_ACOCL|nr:hypothetical protein QJS10_CPA09g00717 [Acorus calamus]